MYKYSNKTENAYQKKNEEVFGRKAQIKEHNNSDVLTLTEDFLQKSVKKREHIIKVFCSLTYNLGVLIEKELCECRNVLINFVSIYFIRRPL